MAHGAHLAPESDNQADAAALDRALLAMVAEAARLTAPRMWINRLRFSSRRAAVAARTRLQRNGWVQQSQLSQFGRSKDSWMLTLWSATSVDNGVIADSRSYLELIAAATNGRYLGWEASLLPALRECDNPDYYPEGSIGWLAPGDENYLHEAREEAKKLVPRGRELPQNLHDICALLPELRGQRSRQALASGLGVLIGDRLVAHAPLAWVAYRQRGGFYPCLLGLERDTAYFPESIVAEAYDAEADLWERLQEAVLELPAAEQ
ncbi:MULTISPECIES: ribonuclease E inhibitor RraB [Actinotignum]|uniref:Regulator of ribonuclease activity B domain-containing protein n=1 Tax=Actinotignum timonense TaxID=1870995 RepID=A0AAW9HP15_9ACTO|nr:MULTISPECIES: hypothetical protein [Actinotignum]MBS5748081.1 hypothetical protein [Actinotignum schaalii]MDE1535992.1 hypothetical protein [Actinotignum schaalii]MDE1559013.1 hypothetical protein [Actinotignum schaalii]MDE1664013.1 hypothetical protein [Actinotignum schaalii]MDK6373029.1 hypothetical protein [Actinotignum timonense]